MTILLALACFGEPPAPAPPEVLPPLPTVDAATVDNSVDPTVARLEALEERIARLEVVVAEMQTTGIYQAKGIGYDPALSQLTARELQSAVDELALAVKELEKDGRPSMGEGGPGMYELKDNSGRKTSQGGPGQGMGGPGMGGQGGGQGGGMGGGGQGGGGQGGGGQGGGGQGGGGQGGGSQGGGGMSGGGQGGGSQGGGGSQSSGSWGQSGGQQGGGGR